METGVCRAAVADILVAPSHGRKDGKNQSLFFSRPESPKVIFASLWRAYERKGVFYVRKKHEADVQKNRRGGRQSDE